METKKVYDEILVFDAYPHFTDKKAFFEKAYTLLKKGGRLWILFDQSLFAVNDFHKGMDPDFFLTLLEPEKEAKRAENLFDTVFALSGDVYVLGLSKI